MPKVHLTQSTVDKLSCQSGKIKTDYFDSKVNGLMVKVMSKGTKSYYIRYKNHRNKWTENRIADASILKLSDARELAQQKLTQITMGDNPFEKRKALKDVPTVKLFVEESYMPHAKSYKRSWDTDWSLLKNHILPAIGHLHLDEVTRRHLVDLFSHHRSTHAPGSTNRVIILCRYIFNCAIRWEVPGTAKNPTTGIDLFPENNQRERYLSEEEAKRLFTSLEKSDSAHLKYIITMLLLTGARKNEVLQAQWKDFDLQQRIWTIKFNKSGKVRHVPLSDGMLQLLAMIPKTGGNPYLFPNPKTGKPYVQIWHSWHTARKRAGLSDVRIHDLRHSFASFLINNGRSLYEVQKLLGHTQIKTTQRYSHLSRKSLIAATNTAAAALPLQQMMPTERATVPLVAAQSID